MEDHLTLRIVILSVLSLCAVEAGTSTCQDIDHNGCVSMAAQNPNMCKDQRIATSVCPQFCGQCPVVCYNCRATAQNMSQCNIITCAQGEKCMIRTKDVSNGDRHYSMICGPKLVCDTDFRKRHSVVSHLRQERNVHSVCCDQDLCNLPSIFTTSTTTTTSTTSTTPPTTTPPATPRLTTPYTHQVPQTHECMKDVVIMLEDSAEIAPYFDVVKHNLQLTIQRLNVSDTQIRIGFGTFRGLHASTVWELNSYGTKLEVMGAVKRLTPHYQQHEAYNILAANHATDSFTTGNRPQVPDVLIIISQAQISLPYVHPNLMSPRSYNDNIAKMRQRYSNVIALAAGSADKAEMQHIATDANHYFYIDPIVLLLGDLVTDTVNANIARMICYG